MWVVTASTIHCKVDLYCKAVKREQGLSRKRILTEAVALADTGGVGSVSMRALAARLGVEAMSLYHWVRNKSELIDGMVELVVAESDPASDSGDWRTAVRHAAVSLHDALARHPWAAGRVMSAGPSPARLGRMDALLGAMRRAGFTPNQTHLAFHVIESHIIGSAMWIATIPERVDELAAGVVDSPVFAGYPHLLEHIDLHARGVASGNTFETGLDLLLDGFAGWLAAA